MAPPEQIGVIAEIDFSGLAQQDIDAIKEIAKDRGVSLEDACKQILLERARELRSNRGQGLFARLFGIGVVH